MHWTRGHEADGYRTGFLPDGDLLIMGTFHHDNVAYRSFVHQLHATAEEGGSSTRNGDIHFRRLADRIQT